jgi:hypothetical protein
LNTIVQTPKKQVLLGATIMALVMAVVYARRENDPSYQGKRLSQHLATLTGFSTSPGGGMLGADLREPIEPRAEFLYPDQTARDAVSQVGTNALPMLIGMLGSKDSQIGLWLEENTRNRPYLKRLVRTDRTKTWVRQMQATAAFHELGPRALPAVPAIIGLLDDPQCAMNAMISLFIAGPPSLGDLRMVMATIMKLWALEKYGRHASNALPLLSNIELSSNSRNIKDSANAAIKTIKADSASALK